MTEALPAIVRQELQRGTFTHAYTACGFLAEAQPRYRFAHLPDACQVFDLASLTKALVTMPLYMCAELSGELPLSAPLSALLEGSEHKLQVNLAQLRVFALLAHQSGLPAWRNFWLGILTEAHTLSTAKSIAILNRSAAQLLDRQPRYSDLNYILAGICLAIKQKKSLDALFTEFYRKHLCFVPQQPFGFCPQAKELAVPTAYCHIRQRQLQGEVHDENCAAHAGVSGHAGLFASGDDLVTYLRQLFTHKVGQAMLRNNSRMLATTAASCLLGMQRGNDGVLSAQGTQLGHLGFTGTSFWLDLKRGSYRVLLTNRTINARIVPHFPTLRQQLYRAMPTFDRK